MVNILLNILQDIHRALYARISDRVNDQQSPDEYSFQYSYFLSSNVTLIMNRRRLWKCLTAIMLINTLPNILKRDTLCITFVLKMVYIYFDNKSCVMILMFYNITRREKNDIKCDTFSNEFVLCCSQYQMSCGKPIFCEGDTCTANEVSAAVISLR